MTKSLVTIAFFVLASGVFVEAARPRGAEAMIAPVESSRHDESWIPALPDIQEPFETTPITPVESAGAPMYE